MIEKYSQYVGEGEIHAIVKLAERLSDFSILHVNSTAAGGGVAEILNRLVPLMRELGLRTDWRVIKGDQEFFKATKTLHNALQGTVDEVPQWVYQVYEKWQEVNAVDLDYDVVFIHDPQPAGLVKFRKGGRWIWRCHIDLSTPHPQAWTFLKKYVSQYDAAIFHIPDFARDDLEIPQLIIPPSIDPLSPKNRPLPPSAVEKTVAKFGVDPTRPILLQVSRFDRAKDPLGVIEAYRLAKRHIRDLQLVYLGGPAHDDPEGEEVYNEAAAAAGGDRDIHLLVLPPDSHVEVNAFQRAATVVMQKSIREGFGLTVAEALWKKKPVVGGKAGGIKIQIIHGVTGYLATSPRTAAHYAALLLKNPQLRQEMGEAGREHVKRNFLITHQLRRYLMAVAYVTQRSGAP
ncbi:MAG: glycosyltransferase [Pyrobaculum sp.]|jgi:trehalose synthase